MKRSFKIGRLLAVLFLLTEFLTPAIATDMFADKEQGRSQQRTLVEDTGRQANPFMFLAESTDTEEEQRDAQQQKDYVDFAGEYAVLPVTERVAAESLIIQEPSDLHYNTRPPLFSLHRHFLI